MLAGLIPQLSDRTRRHPTAAQFPAFQQIPQRPPVLARGFHGDLADHATWQLRIPLKTNDRRYSLT
jgi:hypothetical protein